MSSLSLREVAELIEARFLTPEPADGPRVAVVCAMDLMSDVLSFARRAQLLLTALTNAQAVRTAELSDIAAVCFVEGKRPSDDAVALARQCGISLLVTSLTTFTACGRLAAAGLAGDDA